jgi:beta-mannosidase
VGFRNLAREDAKPDDFRLSVNGTPVFCRGACWTPLDVVSLQLKEDLCREALQQVVDAGFNMLRISGAMVYEDEFFLALCDEYGVLVWQDFMFANMDFPADDPSFAQTVEIEARQHLSIWARHPCIGVICGNSEVSQQAAMWGVSRELWSPPLFHETLANFVGEDCPDVPYWPSSAWGGGLPHQPGAGTTSYYGVGAYLRDVDDARRSGLRFATECLAFANIPEDETLSLLPGGLAVRVQHSIWKARSPRDLGAGWDFDDVRDHYVRERLGVDPVSLRYSDHVRYLTLGKEAVSDAMTTSFTEWRRRDSCCGGALIWFLRDLWPGAGWGIIDSQGVPKAPWHALRRLLQPVWIGLSDEGLNGLALHVGNESAQAMTGQITLSLYRQGEVRIAEAKKSLLVEPRQTIEVLASELLPAFHDLTHAYRFGPLSCDVVIASWSGERQGDAVRRAYFLPDRSRYALPGGSCRIRAVARQLEPGHYCVTLQSSGFARGVQVQADGYRAEDLHFWMAPEETREVRVRAVGKPRPLLGSVTALNLSANERIEVVA